jgi:CubicO group peptidase (beta-lactamase class C family)
MNDSSGFAAKRFVLLISAALLLAAGLWLLLRPRAPRRPENLEPGDYSYAVEYAEYAIRSAMKKHRIPGVFVALMDGGHVIHRQAYGYADIEKQIRAAPDTVFKVGSVSKVFTGLAIMQLQEEGLIDINDALADYLPGFQIESRFSNSPPVTVASLLEHRSGLPRGDTLLGWAWDCRPDVLKAKTDSLQDAHMVYPAGYRYKYSNIGYNVLGRMIEKVKDLEPPDPNSAGAFPYYMKEALFTPLGMHDSGMGSTMLLYGTPPERPVAMGYYRDGRRVRPYNQFDIIDMASGNAQSTLDDMVVFIQALLTADEDSFIKRSMLEEMYRPRGGRGAKDKKQNGLTWFINTEYLEETVIFHDGTNQGFISLLALIPEHGLGLVITGNSEEFEQVKSTLSFGILRALLESKNGQPVPEKTYPAIRNVPESILAGYAGRYLVNDEVIDILFKGGRLKVRYKALRLKLDAIDENTFTFKNPFSKELQPRLVFYPGNEFEGPYMILELGDVFHCPRYPVPKEVPAPWLALTGTYVKSARHPLASGGDDLTGHMEITLEDGILFSSGGFALLPAENNRILIQGGVFHGETMEVEPESGIITWQHLVYTPVR